MNILRRRLEELKREKIRDLHKVDLLKQIRQDFETVDLKGVGLPEKEINPKYQKDLGKVTDKEIRALILLVRFYELQLHKAFQEMKEANDNFNLLRFLKSSKEVEEITFKIELLGDIVFEELKTLKGFKADSISFGKGWKIIETDERKKIRDERRNNLIAIFQEIVNYALFTIIPKSYLDKFEGICQIVKNNIDQSIETGSDEEMKELLIGFFSKKSEEVFGWAGKELTKDFSKILSRINFLREINDFYNEDNEVIEICFCFLQ